jgi:hypothetical protein
MNVLKGKSDTDSFKSKSDAENAAFGGEGDDAGKKENKA